MIHSKKRRAVQPIPIQVDRFSKLIPRHLAKVDTTGRREGEGEGFPEFLASFCMISNIMSDKALALLKYFLKPNLREAAIRVQVEPSDLGGSYMICAIPVWSIIWNLVARERMMSLRMKPRFSEYVPVCCQIAIWRIGFVADQKLEKSQTNVLVFELVKLLFGDAHEPSVTPVVHQVACQEVVVGDRQQGVGADVAVDKEQLHSLLLQLLVDLGQLLRVGCIEVKLAADKSSDKLEFVLGLWGSNDLCLGVKLISS